MTVLEKWLLGAALTLFALAGIFGSGWFAADAHYSQQIAALKSANEQALKDAEAEKAALLSKYAQAAQEVNQDAQKTIGDQSALIGRLRNDASTIRLCAAPAVPGGPVPAPNGPGATAGDRPVASGTGASPEVEVDAAGLDDGLGVAIDALTSEQLYRQWLRGTGQL